MPPVLLVHGYLASQATLLPLKWRLERRGIGPVFTTPLSPGCIQDVRELALQLRTRVRELCAQTGHERIDLVGLSQGGLIALWFLKHLGGDLHVRRFVGLGCPFHGSWLGLAGLPLGLISPGLWQSFPHSSFLRALHRGPLPAGVPITSVAIPGDWVAPPHSCRLEGADFLLAPKTRSPLPHQALILSPGCAEIAADVLSAE